MFEKEWEKIKLLPTLIGLCFKANPQNVYLVTNQIGSRVYLLQVHHNDTGEGISTWITESENIEGSEPISLEDFKSAYNKVKESIELEKLNVNL